MGSRGRPREWGRGLLISLWGFAMDSTQLRKLLPLFPCPTSPLWGPLKGRWAWMVGGFLFLFSFFLPRALEGHQTVLLVTFPPSSPSLSQYPPACSCPARSTTHPTPLFWLPVPPDCLVIYFVSFCVSFSVLSVFLCRFL